MWKGKGQTKGSRWERRPGTSDLPPGPWVSAKLSGARHGHSMWQKGKWGLPVLLHSSPTLNHAAAGRNNVALELLYQPHWSRLRRRERLSAGFGKSLDAWSLPWDQAAGAEPPRAAGSTF